MVVPFRCCQPFWGRVIVFICPPSASQNFSWLVAALLLDLSLIFDNGLICCLAMSLRYVDLLSCGGAPTVGLATGFVALFPVLHSPAGSGCAGSCRFSSPIWFSTFGVPPEESRLVSSSIGTKVWCVPLSLLGCFFVLPLPFGIWSPYGSSLLVGSHLSVSYGCQ